ncbi:MAG: acyl-CoA mutase large subunit family protein [Solirubrobacterales bacterium]
MARARTRQDTEAGNRRINVPAGPVESSHPGIAPDVGPDDPRRFTDSGIEIKPVYRDDDVADLDLGERLGEPGEYPFMRGIHPEMYRSRRWTMRQYAGYATAQETNVRYRYLLEKGSTGLSMAFDLPTQLGRDSDDPLCLGEVGRTGVAIDSIDDMRTAFDRIPLDQVSTSMTINAPAAILLLLYELVGEEQGVPSEQLRGTVQNDILKEYAARGNFIYPPEGAMRLTTDIFAYCHKHVPKWNTISISGYHMREKGCSAVQEVAFTLSNAIAYVQAAIDAGLEVEEFAPQLAFFFNGHNNVFQEVAKFRAVRRMWAEIMQDRFGAQSPRSQMMRFHTQTGGSTLTAQQPENNIVRVALQGFAAVCGGTQSLHTNGFDEALGLPTERSAKIALRTQQVIAEESGAADTVDPFAGSYYVERLTADIERESRALMQQIEDLGGSVHAIEVGFLQREIEEAAWAFHRRIQTRQDVLVGVNEYVEEDGEADVEILKIDPHTERDQVARLKAFKEARDHEVVAGRLWDLREVAQGSGSLLHPLKDALRDRATLGEVCNVMREVFGEYKPPV